MVNDSKVRVINDQHYDNNILNEPDHDNSDDELDDDLDIDDSDDDSPPAPPAAKSATLEKLKACGISISKQKAPTLPSGVRLPPGISLGSSGTNSAPKRPSTSSYNNGEPSTKRVPVDSNVASALTNITGSSSEPKKKVELELSEKQINALKALGML